MLDVEESFDGHGDGVFNPKRKDIVDQGGVNIDEVALFREGMESTLAISEDEPSLREAFNGSECEAWRDAIEAVLVQMEKSMLGSQ